MSVCRFLLLKTALNINFSRSLCSCNTLNNVQKQFRDSVSKSELNLRQRDGLPENYRIVYNAPMKNYISAANIVSFGSMTGFGAYSTWKVYLTMGVIGLPLNNIFDAELINYTPLEIGVCIFGFIATNLALWKVSSDYALRIYKGENSESSR